MRLGGIFIVLLAIVGVALGKGKKKEKKVKLPGNILHIRNVS